VFGLRSVEHADPHHAWSGKSIETRGWLRRYCAYRADSGGRRVRGRRTHATGFAEFDRVLGGGLVPGSVVLIGGEPGAGKSTLLLQITTSLATLGEVLYVSGEESLQQLAMRARRLELPLDRLRVASETRAEEIASLIERHRPLVVVLDSIQVMQLGSVESVPGSITQVRETAAFFTRLAKQTQTVVMLVGHVTKEGSLAGPKVLEHMIDCFVMLDSPEGSRFRTLRGLKNRFGAVNELGVFAMTDRGMKEVSNPSAIFLQRPEALSPGSVATVTWEGTRSLLVELQALVDACKGATRGASRWGSTRSGWRCNSRCCIGIVESRSPIRTCSRTSSAGCASARPDRTSR
jgi:DNA repair protein RadA/Sms